MQNYNIRFRRVFNRLQYSITNEYKDELTPRVMNDRLHMDSVTDYVRGLRSEIGQVLLANSPPNIIDTEKKQWTWKDTFAKTTLADGWHDK